MANNSDFDSDSGHGGETHQHVPKKGPQDGTGHLTTNQGIRVSDNQNSLRSGERGPTLLEDFSCAKNSSISTTREFQSELSMPAVPPRTVIFELYKSLSDITKADLFQRAGEKTPMFTRFSTVAGGAGSVDTPRGVRGFAVKFYTKEENWNLVGNNIRVFFIQDAIKFPDLIHAVKMESDRAFSAGRQRARYVLGLGVFDARIHPYADVGDVGIEPDEGVMILEEGFVKAAARRYWEREPKVRMLA